MSLLKTSLLNGIAVVVQVSCSLLMNKILAVYKRISRYCIFGGMAIAYPTLSSSFFIDKSLVQITGRHLFSGMGILQENPNLTQRELADKLGLSLGGLNYCLRALIDKGFVKMQNFNKAQNKLKFVYLLTPRGIKEKSALTYRFLERKMQEYETLKAEIDTLKGQVALSADAKAKILNTD